MKYIILVLSSFVILAACRQKADEGPPPGMTREQETLILTDTQYAVAGLAIGHLEKKTINDELKVNGVVDVPPQNIIAVSFPMPAYLRSTSLLPGMHLNRGEVIGWMEDMSLIQLQQDYLAARAKMNYLSQELSRQRLLRENEVNALKTLQQVTAEYEGQLVLLKGLEQKLRLIGIEAASLKPDGILRSIPIRSPIRGFVSKVNVNTGKYVNPTDVLFELINPEDLHASLTVFEKDLPRVRVGQKVQVGFVDEPGKLYDCEVILVTRNVDENRSGTLHCHFENRPGNLMPGMFLNASILVERTETWAVPEESILRYGDAEYIFEEEGNQRYRMRKVETGTRDKGWVEILNPSAALQEGRIVTRNGYALLGMLKNTAD